jgi:hypothetical protein
MGGQKGLFGWIDNDTPTHLADAGEERLAVLEEADVEDGEGQLDVPEVARAVRQLPPAAAFAKF